MPTEQTQRDFETGLEELADSATRGALQSDAELLELYLYGGRQDAMATLVQRFAPLVTSVIRRVVSHPQDAEDAFQATFLILLLSAKTIRSRPSIAAWLYGVAYRTACRVRAKSRRQAVTLGEADMPESGAEQNPIVELARRIELGNLDRELENLPEHLREPLTEHYILGYSARQIAERMEMSVSAVEGRLRRGRRLLRHRLALRGTSLSVVVAGAAWFRDHQSTAIASEQWTQRLLESPIFGLDAPSNVSPSVSSSSDSYLAELVQGESTMRFAPFLKSAGFLGAAAIATVSMSVIAVAMQFGPRPELDPARAPGQRVERVQTDSEEAAAEIAIETGRLNAKRPDANKAIQEADAPRLVEPAAVQPGAVQPSAVPRDQRVSNNSTALQPSTAFVRPGGEAPSWLKAGDDDRVASEKLRDTLRQTVEVDFTGLPLRQIIDTFETKCAVDFVMMDGELEQADIDPDVAVTLALNEPPLCDALEAILEPLRLRYEVHPRYIKIVPADNVTGAIRYYDLAYVLPTSTGVRDLVNTIQSTIDEGWISTGTGTGAISVVGSMMVVNCSEKGHRQIEKLLAELSKVDPENLRSPGFSAQPTSQGMGGMGGGGMF